MKITEINTVCFVGAGTMGCFNSLVAAMAGYEVVLYDISAETLEQVPLQHQQMAGMMMAQGLCTQDIVDQALARVSVTTDLTAVTENIDLVSESVAENLSLKREIHASLDTIFPARTIITTNTSALLVSDIESAVGRGDLFAALHSHLGSPLIDIVPGPRTADSTVELLNRYVLSLQCVPLILKKEHPGYVLNSILGSVLTMSMVLVMHKLATQEAVDRAWMLARKTAMGPFGLMDMFGINVVFDSWQYKKSDPEIDELKAAIIHFLSPYIESNELGMKSGKGFYQYPKPSYQQTGEDALPLDADSVSFADECLTSTFILNALLIADKDVATQIDIDRAWKAGMQLDQGPFELLEVLGVDRFIEMLNKQVEIGFCKPANADTAKAYLQRGVS